MLLSISRSCVFFFILNQGRQPEIARLSDFVNFVQSLETAKTERVVYRGHADVCWETRPSLFRNKKTYRSENALFRTLLASQPDSFISDNTMLERLVRMQHYSLPTRLLDVTWNPLVALFFCVSLVEHQNQDGHVLVISVDKEDDKFFDSDTISCITNLANMKSSERNVISKNVGLPVEAFNTLPSVRRLLHFIKDEKSYFQPLVNPSDLQRVLLVRPKLANKRVLAQNGLFMVFGLKHSPLETRYNSSKLTKILIKSEHKKKLLNELDIFGFNNQSMFPELESASKYIAKKFS